MLAELNGLLTGWLRWKRFRRAADWALRGLLAALALSLAFSLYAVSQAWLLRNEFLLLVGALSLFGMLAAALTGYLWPIRRLDAAREFDLAFHLGERVSTALELGQNPERVLPEMRQRQLEDALTSARQVNVARMLPMRLRVRELALVLMLVAAVGLVWLQGGNWFQMAQQIRAVEQAVDEQSAQIEELLSQIENNPSLTDEQKKILSQPLEEALSELENNPSLEGSVSVLTSTSEKLQSMTDAQAEATAQGLQQAGSQLAGQEGSPLQGVGQSLAEGNITAAASQLGNIDTSNLSEAESQALADQLEQMAQSLGASNPQLAEQLNAAAQALRDGDMQAAQSALDQASRTMAQAGQQAAFSQTAGMASQQMQQGAGQVIAAGGGQQMASGGQQPGSAQSGQAGQTPGNGSAGSGAGHGEGSPSGAGSEAGSSPIPQDNGPGDGGQSTYEQIYAPTLLGGDGGPQVSLPGAGEGGEVIGEGPSSPADPGQSLVPYSDVFSLYDQFNREAINNNQVPAPFIPIVRSYFDSLKP